MPIISNSINQNNITSIETHYLSNNLHVKFSFLFIWNKFHPNLFSHAYLTHTLSQIIRKQNSNDTVTNKLTVRFIIKVNHFRSTKQIKQILYWPHWNSFVRSSAFSVHVITLYLSWKPTMRGWLIPATYPVYHRRKLN